MLAALLADMLADILALALASEHAVLLDVLLDVPGPRWRMVHFVASASRRHAKLAQWVLPY